MLDFATARPRYVYCRIGWLLREEGRRPELFRVFCLSQRTELIAPENT